MAVGFASLAGGDTVSFNLAANQIAAVQQAIIGLNALYAGQGDQLLTNQNASFASPTTENVYNLDGGAFTQFASVNTNAYILDSVNGGTASTLQGSYDRANIWVGNNGNDSIAIEGTAQTIFAGDGNDTISLNSASHGGGNDLINVGSGNDSITLVGNGSVVAGNGADTINITGGTDFVTLGGGANSFTFSGQALGLNGMGTDTIHLGSGFDTVTETGAATIYGGSDAATIQGGSGNFDYIGGSGHDSVTAGSGNATLTAGSGNSTFVGGSGSTLIDGSSSSANDSFVGGSLGSQTTMLGGSGNDTFTGGAGNSTMDGGSADNFFYGSAGNNSMVGGSNSAGWNFFYGGSGNDTMVANTVPSATGSDPNTFFFDAATGGNHVIQGYSDNPGGDASFHLDFSGYGLTQDQIVADSQLVNGNQDLQITLPGGAGNPTTTITLKGVTSISDWNISSH